MIGDVWFTVGEIEIVECLRQFRNFHLGGKIRCKREDDYSLTEGKLYEIIEIQLEEDRTIPKDNPYITEPILGYFWIIDDNNNRHCFFIYEGDGDYTRTYKKWFDEPTTRQEKLERIIGEVV